MCYTGFMLAFNHLLAGSIVAVITPAPLVPAIRLLHLLRILYLISSRMPMAKSHLTRDFLKTQIAIDMVLSVIVIGFIMWLFRDNWLIVGMGAFLACYLISCGFCGAKDRNGLISSLTGHTGFSGVNVPMAGYSMHYTASWWSSPLCNSQAKFLIHTDYL